MIKTAFSNTIASWKRYPIIEKSDFSDLPLVVSEYKNKYPYVWIKNQNYDIHPNFNWNFYPQPNDIDMIHAFPVCNFHSKRPINWQALYLVPTSVTQETEIKRSSQIAAYKTDMTPMYIYAFHDKFIMKKYGMISIPERPCHLINNKKTMDEVFELLTNATTKSAWLVNADVRIDNVSLLDHSIGDFDIIKFPVVHQSTGLTYADNSVSLVSIDYIKELMKQKVQSQIPPLVIHPTSGELMPNSDLLEINKPIQPKIKTSSTPIGTVNDAVDPFKAWANAYYTCLYLQYGDASISKKKNKILGAYTGLQSSRVNDLIKAGIQQAEIDILNPEFDYDTFVNWDHIMKRFTDWNTKELDSNMEVLDKRIERIKKIYGEDSEEYQKLSSQFGKSSL